MIKLCLDQESSLTAPHIFTGVEYCEIWHILAFEALHFRNEAIMYRTADTYSGIIDDGCMSLQNLV